MDGKDPFIEANRRAMEYIWTKVPKETKDGVEYVTYVKTDLPYLFYSGLVDTQRYKLEAWLKAFDDCLGEDGRYWVSHEKMIWLGRFRYSKTVNEPFDPLKMRLGKYEVDRLWKVFENSIQPSTSLPDFYIKNVFDAIFRERKMDQLFTPESLEKLKEKGHEIDQSKFDKINFETEGGKEYVILEKPHVEHLRNLLDSYPSPRRKMEMSVASLRTEKLQQMSDIAKNPQKSNFEAGADFRETTKKNLKDMLVKASANSNVGRKPKDEIIDLKGMQKNRPIKF